MQRRHLETALASLGLLAPGCRAPAGEAEPPAQLETRSEPADAEPSGLGDAPKPATATPTATKSTRPRFEALPIAYCDTRFEDPHLPLRRTTSFLEAWNELAPPLHNRLAQNIPHAELDARRQLCGDEQCSIDAPRVTSVRADHLVGVGALIPDAGELLVVPDLARDHGHGDCTDTTELALARHGALLHLTATTEQRRFNYGHYSGHDGGYAGGYAAEVIPLDCYAYATVRRDLVIDLDHDTLVLVLEQSRSHGDDRPWALPRFEPPGIRVGGCGGTLELRWTGSGPPSPDR